MSAATFVLAISLFVAFTFATAFGVASLYARSNTSARWLAAGYAFGMFNPLLEILLPTQADARLIEVAVPLSLQYGAAMGVIALARHYRLSPPWRTVIAFVLGTLLLNILILDLPRDSALRHVLYQSPYFIVHVLGVITILRFPRRKALDNALVSLFALSAVQFLIKPILAVNMGSGTTAQNYIGTTYAAISQSVGSMLLIATGILLLLIILRDVLAEMTARSETDTLSGLLNRRGFEARAEHLIGGATPCAVVVADLDHFKSVNDSFGHAAGDGVIVAFADLLAQHAKARTILGRVGGEEFIALLPHADAQGGQDYAEQVRRSFASLALESIGGRPVSASFGIAGMEAGETLTDLLRRADIALYEAKRSGRNRVCAAPTKAEKSPAVRGQGLFAAG
ncbi:diguanylate cyclase (GGDEF) domain-containing protein [Devosia sp. YR412]|uniref:GGDEF domain-containing protein n=1 Tax=Devosia sp. YR412 TaxID=1881030 RepID=UPI0008D1CAD0|nr:GGDEF domain-containing protein [Devosia sp. YR412]SEQ25477.1 diguanylate cyclase (GGDEF) domain-containing protein [Devosia sp. YR412]